MDAGSNTSAGFDPKAFVRSLTHRPGVYRMLDPGGRILYVGKARDLRRRVGNYFSGRAHDAKTTALLAAVARVEVTVTSTEQEALLLEYNLIKEHRPRFNVVLRDDKSYPYIHVTTAQPFPRFDFHRGSRRGAGRYLGPFPNAGAVREALQDLQKLFRVRNCSDSYFANRSRPCLQYQLQRCTAPCVGLVDRDEYGRDVANAIAFIEGRNQDIEQDLVARMEQASTRQAYELAARYRDQIASLRRVQAQQAVAGGPRADADAVAVACEPGQVAVAVLMVRGGRVLGSRSFAPRAPAGAATAEILAAFVSQHYLTLPAPPEILLPCALAEPQALALALTGRAGHPVALRHAVRGARRRWLGMAADNAVAAARQQALHAVGLDAQFAALGEALGLPTPQRIECFDVSHLSGGETVASCVVFGPQGSLKSDYRRFNIRDVPAGDDYAALAQVINRRYARLQRGDGQLPDLVLVDGGRGQLARAAAELRALGLAALPLVAVAKGAGRRPGRERLFRPDNPRALVLPADSPALHVIQQLRDEAHRFAITGHRQRRQRQRLGSVLEQIPGLGPRRRRALLQQFGGLQGVLAAGVDDLARTTGISRPLAERIYGFLHDEAGPAGNS